jgi:hypothetical protein
VDARRARCIVEQVRRRCTLRQRRIEQELAHDDQRLAVGIERVGLLQQGTI